VSEAEALETTCCVAAPLAASLPRCPVSQTSGQPVGWTTVAALSLGAIPPRQEVWLCMDPACDAVYFGDRGLQLLSAQLRAVPAFKIGSEGVACHCFQHSQRTIEQEVRALGSSPTVDAIRARVRNRDCACEVRNPTGKCCLRDIQQLVDRTNEQGAQR